MGDNRGRYVWFELLTHDPKKAIAFYTKVVGWGTEAFPGPNNYTVWMKGEDGVGGVMEMPAEMKAGGAPPNWAGYIFTADVDKTTEQAKKLGGTVYMPPTEIPTVGRFSVLADPAGVAFNAFTPAPTSRDTPDAPAGIGDCSWYEIVTTDVEKTWAFMTALFGWEKKGPAHDMGPLGAYQEYGRPGIAWPSGGIFKKPADMPAPSHIQLYFRVGDVAKATDTVKANGGQVLNGPMEVPGGDIIVNCLDDQGAAFSMHQSNK
jgi:predicted enzyme related to lactoylglutathione lyase